MTPTQWTGHLHCTSRYVSLVAVQYLLLLLLHFDLDLDFFHLYNFPLDLGIRRVAAAFFSPINANLANSSILFASFL